MILRPTKQTLTLLVLLDVLSVCHGFISIGRLGAPKPTEAVLKSSTQDVTSVDLEKLGARVKNEAVETFESLSIAAEPIFRSDESVSAEEIVQVCDEIDAINPRSGLVVSDTIGLRKSCLEFKRYELLSKLMRKDYDGYIAVCSFLSPSRIPRFSLPNLQDVPLGDTSSVGLGTDDDGAPLVPDCNLENMEYKDSVLDNFLLQLFRKQVTEHTGGMTSDKDGIFGLVEQGRNFMLRPGQTPEAQHQMVRSTLRTLMTPFLPPFYRIFMSGIVPKLGTDFDGKQFGPWFYAPFLTSFVTPTFFGFLVGPSVVNRRKDGRVGGLVVEKCKFLQESGCKGLCLHQCKLPAQQFFGEELGLPLTVTPNFATQECQWSFGEEPLPPSEDASFPKGCLVGCESRKAIAASGSTADACN
mmetsp:Transcript_13380/g.19684  ORF Transcript_13380/g.19684 Transcript_13380/m.19684 type:complete len:412 (-) Transcript_13380:102-1337(-)